MHKKLILILMILFTQLGYAQDSKEDIDGVKSAIQNYYDGYIYRDITKLNMAFDTIHGTMKVPIEENGKVIGFQNRYFKEVVPKWGNRKPMAKEMLDNCALEVLSIDLTDNQIAIAKIRMKVDTITYIDILSLHKIKGQWKITNKMYVVREN
jgi:hypothetical protein